MKKKYEKPFAEKMEFDYRETVIASIGSGDVGKGKGKGGGCDGEPYHENQRSFSNGRGSNGCN